MDTTARLLLPRLLREHRRRLGVAQKKLALEAGVDVTALCAWEKGRRPPPDDRQLKAVAQALALSEREQVWLQHAARHDRVVRLAVREGLVGAAFISFAIEAAAVLAEAELLGLVAEVQRYMRSAREVGALAAKAKEAEMDG